MTTQRPATTEQPQQAQTMPSEVVTASYQRLFIVMALTMSWRLALVVIVPILGGHALDEHYHLSPWLTLAGLALAAIGVFGVLHKTVTDANARMEQVKPKRVSK